MDWMYGTASMSQKRKANEIEMIDTGISHLHLSGSYLQHEGDI